MVRALISLVNTLRGIEVFRIVYRNFLDGDCFVIANFTGGTLPTICSGSHSSSTRQPA